VLKWERLKLKGFYLDKLFKKFSVRQGKLPVGINWGSRGTGSQEQFGRGKCSQMLLKTLIMLGITQISKEVNKKSKIGSEDTTKKVLNAFLEVAKQKLLQGESISFKGYFIVKRSATQPKGSKHCNKHEKSLNDFKQANKGKGVLFYAKSDKFKNLVLDTRKCKDCQKKKQDLLKSAKPTNRVSFKVSKDF